VLQFRPTEVADST